jgi:hypothetical protein
MQPGDDRDRKRAGEYSASDLHHLRRRRRRGSAAADVAAEENSARRDGPTPDPTDLTAHPQARGSPPLRQDTRSGLARDTSTMELERQLREQMLLNQLLQNRQLSRRDSQSFDPRFGQMPPLSFQRLQPPFHYDALRYNPDMEALARQASERALGLAAARLGYSERGERPPLMRDPVEDRRRYMDSSSGEPFPGPGQSTRVAHQQQMLEQALLQQLAQQRSYRHGAGLNEPLSDLEQFSRGLGEYAMIHHQRNRDLPLSQRVPSMQMRSHDAFARDLLPSMDMRSARLPAVEEQKFGTSTALSETDGRPMALSSDVEQLTVYQVLIRRSLEYFVAGETDVATSVRGRKQKIRVGQIGVRCKYCAHVPLRQRSKGAVYYAKSLINVYQAAQNIATAHFATDAACPFMPSEIREEIAIQRPRRDASKAGRSYWVEACRMMGIVERDDALWFGSIVAGDLEPPEEQHTKGKSEDR